MHIASLSELITCLALLVYFWALCRPAVARSQALRSRRQLLTVILKSSQAAIQQNSIEL